MPPTPLQLATPTSQEDGARAFYKGALGVAKVAKAAGGGGPEAVLIKTLDEGVTTVGQDHATVVPDGQAASEGCFWNGSGCANLVAGWS